MFILCDVFERQTYAKNLAYTLFIVRKAYFSECSAEKFRCISLSRCRHFLGRAARHDVSASVSALRAEVDDVVGTLDDVEIVLNDHDGMSAFDECAEHVDEAADIVVVQAGGRLVEYK